MLHHGSNDRYVAQLCSLLSPSEAISIRQAMKMLGIPSVQLAMRLLRRMESVGVIELGF